MEPESTAACTISVARSALADLGSIRRWYAEQDVPEVGQRLVGEVFDRLEALRSNPRMGREVPEFQQSFLRELIVPPFRVVYRHDPGRIRVVRVWRSERLLQPGSL